MENKGMDWGNNFQTPENVCAYMASFVPNNAGRILEPTSGKGNLVRALSGKGLVVAPDNFYAMPNDRFDWVVMNPPFTPMTAGYEILFRCMELSDNVVALMPWLTIINSEKRLDRILDYGLKSITHLPRNTFKGSRVQTCVLEMRKGCAMDETVFKRFV